MTTAIRKPTTSDIKKMKRERRSRVVDIVDSRAEGDAYEITVAANNVARDNFDLDLGSLRTENYLRNPVVMWAHDTHGMSPSGGLPIGRTTEIGKDEDGRIRARFEFLPDDDFADRVRNAWDKGFIRAASISWGGGDLTFLDNGMIRETDAELFEWSLVSVPADQDALRSLARELRLPEEVLTSERHDEEAAAELSDQLSVLTERIDTLSERIDALEGDDEEDEDDEGGDEELESTDAAGEDDEDRELAELAAELEEFTASLKEQDDAERD